MAFKKTELNDYCQSNKIPVNGYQTTITKDGFVSVLTCGDRSFTSKESHPTKKAAENDVATIALETLTLDPTHTIKGELKKVPTESPIISTNTSSTPDSIDPRSGQVSSSPVQNKFDDFRQNGIPYTAVLTSSENPEHVYYSSLLSNYCQVMGLPEPKHKIKDLGQNKYTGSVNIGDKVFTTNDVFSKFEDAKHSVNCIAIKELNILNHLQPQVWQQQQQLRYPGQAFILTPQHQVLTYRPVLHPHFMQPVQAGFLPAHTRIPLVTTPSGIAMMPNKMVTPALYPQYTNLSRMPAPLTTETNTAGTFVGPQVVTHDIKPPPGFSQEILTRQTTGKTSVHTPGQAHVHHPELIPPAAFTQNISLPENTQQSGPAGNKVSATSTYYQVSTTSTNSSQRATTGRPSGQGIISINSAPPLSRPSSTHANAPPLNRPSSTHANSPPLNRPSSTHANTPLLNRPSSTYANSPPLNRPSSTHANPPPLNRSSTHVHGNPPPLSKPSSTHTNTPPLTVSSSHLPASYKQQTSLPAVVNDMSSQIPSSQSSPQPELNYKQLLNEYAQKSKLPMPAYDAEYPTECVGYVGVVEFNGQKYRSTPDKNKKRAQNLAAGEAMRSLSLLANTPTSAVSIKTTPIPGKSINCILTYIS